MLGETKAGYPFWILLGALALTPAADWVQGDVFLFHVGAASFQDLGRTTDESLADWHEFRSRRLDGLPEASLESDHPCRFYHGDVNDTEIELLFRVKAL